MDYLEIGIPMNNQQKVPFGTDELRVQFSTWIEANLNTLTGFQISTILDSFDEMMQFIYSMRQLPMTLYLELSHIDEFECFKANQHSGWSDTDRELILIPLSLFKTFSIENGIFK